MKKIIITSFFALSLFVVTQTAFALDPNAGDIKSDKFQLLPCDGVEVNGQGVPCDYNAFINGFNNLVKVVIYLSIPFAVVMLMWAGFLYMTAGEKPANKEKAKRIFSSIAVGLIIILSAWLVIYTLIDKLVSGSDAAKGGSADSISGLKK